MTHLDTRGFHGTVKIKDSPYESMRLKLGHHHPSSAANGECECCAPAISKQGEYHVQSSICIPDVSYVPQTHEVYASEGCDRWPQISMRELRSA